MPGANNLPKGRISETLVDQNNNQAQNGIIIPTDCLSVTITCNSNSGNNALVGWNEPASTKNVLQPGESIPYGDLRVKLDGNKLYIGFASGGSNGKVRITYLIDTGGC